MSYSDSGKMILKLWKLFEAGWEEDYEKAEEIIFTICKCVEVTA